MLIAIVGMPGSGATTLARGIARATRATLVTSSRVFRDLENRSTPTAAQAHELIRSGKIPPTPLRAKLWADAIGLAETCILVNFPREETELLSFRCESGQMPNFVYLAAPVELIDSRRQSKGLRPIEVEHPGAFDRLTNMHSAIRALANAEGVLLELQAAESRERLVAAVVARFFPTASR